MRFSRREQPFCSASLSVARFFVSFRSVCHLLFDLAVLLCCWVVLCCCWVVRHRWSTCGYLLSWLTLLFPFNDFGFLLQVHTQSSSPRCMMKLSFSLPSKQSSKPNVKASNSINDEDPLNQAPESTTTQEYVTEFDSSSKPQTELVQSKKHLVIPPKENEWRPHKKMKNLDLPPISSSSVDGHELQFEVEPSNAASDSVSQDPGTTMSYGLNLRHSSKNDGGDPHSSDKFGVELAENVLLKKLKDDLHNLPEDEGFEQFDEVPVEGFGAALLAGYGWHEGRGIGRNAKEDVKVVEYKQRAGKEGFGFVGDQKANTNIPNADIRLETKDSGFSIGREVRIIHGKHMGMKGKVAEVPLGGDLLILKLSSSGQEVKVHVLDITELGSVEEEKCLKKLKDLKIQEASKGDARRVDKKAKESSDRSGNRERRGGIDDVECNVGGRDMVKQTKVSWLRSHIKVRIVSKDFKGGRLYLKKGEVVDVVGPTTCDVAMDDSRELIQGVDQDILETALPRRGGPVLVLLGKHKGVYGSLVERNTENETGMVQDADTREFLNVRLEQIAEYIGDPSYIGY